MRIGRREFMERAALGAGGILLGWQATAARAAAAKTFDPYEIVTLGKTGIKLSRVGLGTGMKGWKRQSNHTRMGQEAFTALVRGAYERGVRWFDMADLYGTHPFLAAAMAGVKREKYAMVTKIWWAPRGLPEDERQGADVVVRRFLKELKTDYIDLVLLHCVQSATWPTELKKHMDLLAGLKKKGVIRAHGVSCHTVEALTAASKEPWVDSIHARINPFEIRTDGPMETVVPILKQAKKNGKAVVGMKIVGQGDLGSDDEKFNQSVRFALTLGAIDTMTVGFEKIDQIDDFAARVRKVPRPASK